MQICMHVCAYDVRMYISTCVYALYVGGVRTSVHPPINSNGRLRYLPLFSAAIGVGSSVCTNEQDV